MLTEHKNNIDELILQHIKSHPGSKARQIAQAIGFDKKDVNSRLYGSLRRNGCYQDDKYRWFYGDSKASASPNTTPSVKETVLSKMCRYYSACIAEDIGTEVSVFAQSKYDLDYKELEQLPMEDASLLFDSTEVQAFLSGTRSDKANALYFGYPVASIHKQSRKSNWEGYVLGPIFLFPMSRSVENNDHVDVDWNFAIINKLVIAKFTGAKGEELINEIVHLEEELGLGVDQVQPEGDCFSNNSAESELKVLIRTALAPLKGLHSQQTLRDAA